MKNLLTHIVSIILAAGATGVASAGTGLPVSDLTALPPLLEHIEQNASLQRLDREWRAATVAAEGADALPDPMLQYTYYVESVETRVGPQQQRVGMAQTLPWFGKRRLRAKAATAHADALQSNLAAGQRQVRYRIIKTWLDLYYLTREVEITEEQLLLLKQQEQAMAINVQGGGSLSPLSRLKIRSAEMQTRHDTAVTHRQAVLSRLASLLNRPVRNITRWPDSLPEWSLEQTEPQLAKALQANNPALQAAQHQLINRQQRTALAQRDNYPDLQFKLDYIDTGSALMPDTPDSGKDPVLITVGINLPIWRDRYRSEQQQARFQEQATRQALDERQLALESALADALFQYREANDRIQLYSQTVIPQTQTILDLTEQETQTGEADYQEWIDAQSALFRAQLALEQARCDRLKAYAVINQLTAPNGAEP